MTLLRLGIKEVTIRSILKKTSIEALFARVGPIDALISTTGHIAFAPLHELTEEQYTMTINNKLLGHIKLFNIATKHLTEGGSITMTSGYVTQHPIPGSAAVSMVNAALDAFVKAAALELDEHLRINTVSPLFVKETMEIMGMDSSEGISAADTAKAYRYAIEGKDSGKALDVRDYI
ncbi:MAG: NAD(P)-dependent dehydrogenase (short-subunit alcohol dehydrogenase family) [Psychromonas sp.]|jgi:NAD(P)-dependent dehydrogenase (short-subunit alcohol dehydrogenase family)